MDTPPLIPEMEEKCKESKKKKTNVKTGCGCLVILFTLFVVIALSSIVQLPQDQVAVKKDSVTAASEIPEEKPIPPVNYTATLNHKKDGIKLVLNVNLDAALDNLPNEIELERISRKLFQEWGGKNYERMFMLFQIPKLDPIPASYWAKSEFNPDFKVGVIGASSEDGKWLVAQRDKKWEGSGVVIGRWYSLEMDARLTTLVKDGDKCIEYWEMRGSNDLLHFTKLVQKVNGSMRYTDENDKKFYWEIDKDGRWCQYQDGKLYGVELPLGDKKTNDVSLWGSK